MRISAPRPPGLPTRIQTIADCIGSIKDLANLSGISRRSILNWASGRIAPHPAMVLRLATIAKVSPDWIFRGEGEPPATGAQGAQQEIQNRVATSSSDFVNLTPAWDQPVHSIQGISRVWAHMHLGLGADQLVFMTATDDDLAPIIERNEPVIIRLIPEEDRPFIVPDPNDIYLVNLFTFNGQPIGNVHPTLHHVLQDQEPGTWMVPKYLPSNITPPMQHGKFSIDPMQIIGKAIWKGQRIMHNRVPEPTA